MSSHLIQFTLCMDHDTMAEVKQYAKVNKLTRTNAVRELIDLGIETDCSSRIDASIYQDIRCLTKSKRA